MPNWAAPTNKAYRAYVEQGIDAETQRFYALKSTPALWGDNAFKELACAKAQSLGREIDRRGLKQPVALLSVIGRVAEHYGLPTGEILQARRGQGAKNLARWVAMKLCRDVGGAKLQDIAALFHVGHYSTVSQTIGRLHRAMAEDKRPVKVINKAKSGFDPLILINYLTSFFHLTDLSTRII